MNNAAIIGFIALSLAGAVSITAGIALIAGAGWSLVAFGACAFAGAFFIKRGIE